MLAAATLVYSLFVFAGGEQFFRDSDSGWHIRSGEWILAHHALPDTDPYSFSKAAQPWVLWEWGSDVLMGVAYRIDGVRGITALVAVALSACSWMWCRLNFVAGGDFFLTALLAPLMVTTTSLHWLARPHVFSWLFLLGALLYAESRAGLTEGPRAENALARFRWAQLAAISAVTAVWANMHASFVLAPAIAGVYALSHFVRPLLWPLESRTEREKARWFLCAALAAAAGSFLNPYGWRLHAHVFSYLLNVDLTSRVAEFQSFNFHDKDATQIALTMGVAALGGSLALVRGRLSHFLLAVMFLWGGLRSARVLPLVALAILPLANGALIDALRAARGLRRPVREMLDDALSYSFRIRLIDRRLNGAGFLAAAALACLLLLRAPVFSSQIGFSKSRFPVVAVAAVEKLPLEARLLAPDSYGGYLIYRFNAGLFNAGRKVYVDGRSDFYGADFMQQYVMLMSARPGWQEIVRAFGFTHALLPDESALKASLEQAGWVRLYQDRVATLLEAR
jgi:hypothetical protein